MFYYTLFQITTIKVFKTPDDKSNLGFIIIVIHVIFEI